MGVMLCRDRLESLEEIDKEHATETDLVGDVLLLKQKGLYEIRDETHRSVRLKTTTSLS